MRISIGYPTAQAERMLFEGINPRQALESLQPVIDQETLKNYKPKCARSRQAKPYWIIYSAWWQPHGRRPYSVMASHRGRFSLVKCRKSLGFYS